MKKIILIISLVFTFLFIVSCNSVKDNNENKEENNKEQETIDDTNNQTNEENKDNDSGKTTHESTGDLPWV